MEIIFHADDFGISESSSRRILSCSDGCGGHGVLNSLSVLATSPAFDTCTDMLEPWTDAIHVGLHLNVVEGPCCADPADIPLLVDEQGIFCRSFTQLLSLSRGDKRDDFRAQLDCELGAQLERFLGRFPRYREHLRLDSHQHCHLIPAMFEATLDVIEQHDCELEYLRIPAEPVMPFLATPGVALSRRPINWVKHWVLNWLWRQDRATFPTYRRDSAIFCGILLSGGMVEPKISALLPHFERYADDRNMALEFLCHPGGVDAPDECLNPDLPGFVDFYVSANRAAEATMLQTIEIPERRSE